MTELLAAEAEVRLDPEGRLAAVRVPDGWRRVDELALTWRVETDWWRPATPIRRDYVRCLLAGGECVELYRDLDAGSWHWARRYD
ncbi:MAG: hypothetical protein JOZ46_11615 [Candidatus Dormibacteraeota bacterium]|nr:hypothetical protein [Candidatus Dormibacteraeota bacterium]MBV9526450.1 hypothetical protein [Candidatus Dormibacteraeota bacterium]